MSKKGNLPNLLLAGAPKCGTTSVYDWLIQHPEIAGGTDKELFYLIDKGDWKFNSKSNWQEGKEIGYRKYFPTNNKIIVDGTTLTMYQQSAVEYASLHKPKVLIFIRKPSARVYSTFKYFRDTRTILPEAETFESFVAKVKVGEKFNGVNQLSDVLEQSKYSKYLAQWLQAVGKENLRVFTFEDMLDNKSAVMKKICDWLEIDDSIYQNFDFSYKNETSKIRFRWLNKIKELTAKQLKNKRIKDAIRPYYDKLNRSKKVHPKNELELQTLKQLDILFSNEHQKSLALTESSK